MLNYIVRHTTNTNCLLWVVRFRRYGYTNFYQWVQNHETSRTTSFNCGGNVTMLEHVFINLNLCCIEWYKFHVCRGKGSRDTITQIYPCASKSWKMVYLTGLQLHIWWGCHNTLHSLINLLHPMVQVSCPWVVAFRRYDWTNGYPCAPKPQNMVNFTDL